MYKRQQNIRPVPVKTIELTSWSSINPLSVEEINSILLKSNAFLEVVPESVTIAVEPSFATSTAIVTRGGTYTSIA